MGEVKKKRKFKFEQALSDLEAIVGRLDSGDLSLDEMLKDFEAGVKLVKDCQKYLGEAQKRVEQLISEQGKLDVKEIEPGPGGEESSD